MFRTRLFKSDLSTSTDLSFEECAEIIQSQSGVLWVDIYDEPADRCREIFKHVFNFHPLVIEDALQDSNSPKINEWDGYLYVVIHSPASGTPEESRISTDEIDIFLSSKYIVTVHKAPVHSIDQLWETNLHNRQISQKGASYILYSLGGEVVNVFLQLVDQIDQDIDEFEDVIFENPQQVKIEDIFTQKRDLIHLRRMLAYQREVYNKLARDEYREIDSSIRIYFRDIYDNFVLIHDLAESLREMISGTLDIYLSMVNNQMGQVMKTLTVFTALFLPLSFITGFFGMNFFASENAIDPLPGNLPFSLILLLMGLLPVSMFLWMHRRKWF